jgi:DNA-binding transcriptional MerR regulator
MPEKTAELWTIAELAEQVAAALSVNFAGVANGRVRDTPDLRAIRYYTTIGLLDRPAVMRGRTALYSKRHMQQLVAIKRLQAEGLSLVAIQQRLLGIGNRELEKLADIQKRERGAQPARRMNADSRQLDLNPPAGRDDFWKAVASEAPAVTAKNGNDVSVLPEVLTLVPLATGVFLGIEATRKMQADDINALRAAAEPLRQVLFERRLVRPERESHGQAHPDIEPC